MKDLIIGCSTNYTWNTLKYWVNSIKKSGFDGDVVLILFNCDAQTVQKLTDSDVTIVALGQDQNKNLIHNSKMPVHVERFLHIYEYLFKYGDYRYVITTDVKDVIFQKNPIEWLENNLRNKNCVFSSESIRYQDEPLGKSKFIGNFWSLYS